MEVDMMENDFIIKVEENSDEEFNAVNHLLSIYYNNRKPNFKSSEDELGVFW